MGVQLLNDGVPTSPIVPRSGAPRVIGILNIVFGSALGLGGICCGIYLIMLSALSPMLEVQQAQMQQQFKDNQLAQRAAQLKELEEQAEVAETEEEKQSIRDQQKELEAAPLAAMPAMPDMTQMYGMNDPRVIGFSLTDMLSMILLNVLLIISGVGLVGKKEWGRKMGFAVAGIKIVRLIVLQAFSVFVIVPTMTKQMSEAMEQMMSQMPPGPGGAPPPMGAEFATVYGTLMTISAVCMVVFGSIYPIIVLWVLSRPEAKMYSQSVETTK